MNYGKSRAFIGAYVALVVHVLLAAALGVAIAQLFSVTVLCFTTATVFLLLVAWIQSDHINPYQPSWGPACRVRGLEALLDDAPTHTTPYYNQHTNIGNFGIWAVCLDASAGS